MAAITICSDFGAQKNKVWHCSHCFSIYLPQRDRTRCHDLVFWMVNFKAHVFTLLFHFHQIPDHLTCLLRNLYAGQEATVKTGHWTTDWFQIGKEVRQGYILSPCLFNLYAEYIMRSFGLDDTQAGIKIARRNINNLRYAEDITVMVESEEELKRL